MPLKFEEPSAELSAYQRRRIVTLMSLALVACPDIRSRASVIETLARANFAPGAIIAYGAAAARTVRRRKQWLAELLAGGGLVHAAICDPVPTSVFLALVL